jgi:hypothetical protein
MLRKVPDQCRNNDDCIGKCNSCIYCDCKNQQCSCGNASFTKGFA